MHYSVTAATVLVWTATILPSSDSFPVTRLVSTTTPTYRRQRQQRAQPPPAISTILLGVKPSKWDNLVDEDYDYYNTIAFNPVAPDMTYVERNLKSAHNTLYSMRSVGI